MPIPVVSVGNITVGGTGKSPMTRWVVERLREFGRRPMIALRGYGARDPAASDEANEHAALLPSVTIFVGADRAAGIRSIVAGGSGRRPDCAVLDDGFQHRRVHRDLDLVLIDAARPCLDGALLPSGWLREPPRALRRADAVIVTNATRQDAALSSAIERWHGRPPIAWMRPAWRSLRVITHEGETDQPVHWLRGRRIVTAPGVGNPGPIAAMVRALGAESVHFPLRDHQRWSDALLEHLRRASIGRDGVLVTGKDWVKIAPLIHSNPAAAFPSSVSMTVIVPRLAIEPLDGTSVAPLLDLLRGKTIIA